MSGPQGARTPTVRHSHDGASHQPERLYVEGEPSSPAVARRLYLSRDSSRYLPSVDYSVPPYQDHWRPPYPEIYAQRQASRTLKLPPTPLTRPRFERGSSRNVVADTTIYNNSYGPYSIRTPSGLSSLPPDYSKRDGSIGDVAHWKASLNEESILDQKQIRPSCESLEAFARSNRNVIDEDDGDDIPVPTFWQSMKNIDYRTLLKPKYYSESFMPD